MVDRAPDEIAPLPPAARWRRVPALDLALGALGVLMGLSSLAYPFGRDQGLYFYVAREWIHGAVPYRDVFDHKTPGIYLIHVAAIELFGEHMWGIRVLELVAVVLLGVLAASLPMRRGDPIPSGLRGLGVLVAAILFYGFLNYWDSSQSEIWYSMFGLGSVWAVRRMKQERRALLVAGAFAGAVIVMKPPGVWLIFVALWQLVSRAREATGAGPAWRRVAVPLGWFAIGGTIVLGPILGYFAAKGALPEMYRIAVQANSYYIKHETGVHSASDLPFHLLNYLFEYNPFPPVILVGAAAAAASIAARADRVARERLVLACVLCLAAYGCVFMQLKFYRLHWTVMLGPVVATFVVLAMEAVRIHPRVAARPALYAAGVALFLYVLSDWRMRWWVDMNVTTVQYLRSQMSRADYVARFNFPETDFSYSDSETVGLFLKANTGPDDYVSVRGFQPEIYAISGTRYPGRFFWTTFITSDIRESAAHRAVWLEEDRRALAEHPPKYIVTLRRITEGPDSSAWFAPQYAPVLQTDNLTVLGRSTP